MGVIPAWLNQAPGVDFGPETLAIEILEGWATKGGWTVSDGSNLPLDLRKRTDVLFERPGHDQTIRVAALQKSRNGRGAIRLDSSTLRTLEPVYQPRQKHWRVEAGGVPCQEYQKRERRGRLSN